MKKNRSSKIIIVVSLILILSTTSVLAAPFDLVHINNPDKNHKFTEFVDSPTVFDEVVEDVDYYLIESGEGSLYYVSEVNDATSDGTSFNDAISNLDPYEGEINEDITAEAELYGTLLGVDSYSIYIKGASNEDVERVRINDKEVTFEIIEGVLMVNTTEDVNSMDILVNGITVEVSLDEEEPESDKGPNSRKNPAKIGETELSWYDDYSDGMQEYEVTVEEIIRGQEAWSIIHEENMFNDPPLVGMEYILAKINVKVTWTETDSSISFDSWDFDIFSGGGASYDRPLVVEPEPEFDFELYPGGEKSGWMAVLVDKNDSPVISINRGDEGEKWFALY